MKIRQFAVGDTEQVVSLWEECGLTRPWNDPHADVKRKLDQQPELFLVGEVDGRIVASGMGGYDGHRGHVNYLAVAPEHRGQGLGRELLAHLESLLVAMGCPKVNIQVRAGNAAAVAFYEHCGYEVFQVADLGKRLIPDA
ncbi:MAG: GNAT family acetyltransferase [Propionibacteriaceae bacterium]|jgi:ribosomal protein S18 acetylase RimI-like enzyme|nr:GNAT family acetyltransferase [Propionibacteriaceae bacterium]